MEFSLERVIAMRDALDKLLSEVGTIVDGFDQEPSPESIAAKEFLNFKRPLSIKTVQTQSYLLLESACDYVSCLVKSLTEPVETIAPWSLARGVMECSAYSIWLGRPDINAKERVKRSLAFRLKGLQEQSRLNRETNQSIDTIKESFNKLNLLHFGGHRVKS